ncbi:MAG TPA: acyl-CoA dehydrogenase family protein [Candidatus Bathyarchaeia archaeon]|jgi:alkylation response protein AidB-like acyl-CoA dehydrogenase|nr:acyl-CoA dehydrogenase family protein [Candidatus Bathyarchaeia archaeon]
MGYFGNEQKELIQMLYGPGSQDHLLLLESLGDFIEKEIEPTAREIDVNAQFPRENCSKLFEQGFTSMGFPKEYGGLELPWPVYVAAMEMVGKACASTALTLAIHGTCCEGVRQFSSPDQKKQFLPEMISGKSLAAFSLTEPGSGSDARNMKTIARLDGDDWVVNGTKMFTTNGGYCDLYFLFAKTPKGPSAFLVDSKKAKSSKDIEKLGVRGSVTSEVVFENAKIPRENLVGTEGEGFDYAKRMLWGGRVTIGALSTGIAQAAFEKAVRYSKERTAFGKTISEFEMTQSKLADMLTMINASRMMIYRAAHLKSEGKPFESEAAQGKLLATESALKVCNEAIQIYGGYGYADEFDVHRHWRDARLMTVGEGTSEIMRLIISKGILHPS